MEITVTQAMRPTPISPICHTTSASFTAPNTTAPSITACRMKMTVRSALEGAEVEPEASAPVTEPAAPEATPAVSGPDAEAPDARETEPEPESRFLNR